MELTNKAVGSHGLTATVGASVSFSENAASFDGTSSSAWDISLPLVNGGMTTWAASVIVKWDGVASANTRTVFHLGVPASYPSNGFSLQYYAQDSVIKGFAGGYGQFSFAGTLPAGKWVSLVVNYNPTTNYSLYVDGADATGTTAPTYPYSVGGDEFHIGQHSLTGSGMKGFIREVSLYNRNLTYHEIIEIANQMHRDKSNV